MKLDKAPISQIAEAVLAGQKQLDEIPSSRRNAVAVMVEKLKKEREEEAKKITAAAKKKGKENASEE